MMKFVTIAIAIAVIFMFLRSRKSSSSESVEKEKKEAIETPVEMKQDPVCGSFVDEKTKFKVKYYDKVYYFCSEECKQKFIDEKKTESNA